MNFKRINIVNTVIGVGVGVADEVLADMDIETAKTAPTKVGPLKGKQGIGRMAMLGVGLAGMIFDVMPEQATALYQSALPGMTKAVYKYIKLQSKPVAERTYVPGYATQSHVSVGSRIGSRYPAPENQNEFDGVRLS